jgi:uncharacterized protein (TIGR03435 family)
MRDHSERRKLFLATAAIVALALPVVTGVLLGGRLRAQAPTVQSPTVPQWQTDAGGEMAFEVASVKHDFAPFGPSTTGMNVPLGDTDNFTPTGGLFRATDHPLLEYVYFAYKLSFQQFQVLRAEAPKWVVSDRFDIEARAAGNPTKDQYRLMIQALLADRFKMAAHLETRQLPVYALVLQKPGKTGPQLRPFPDGTPCSTEAPSAGRGVPSSGPLLRTVPGGFPAYCGLLNGGFVSMTASVSGSLRTGVRNVTWDLIERGLAVIGGQMRAFDRPLLDQTGLSGPFDFAIEWVPQPLPGAAVQADQSGPTLQEAMKDQLGIKLEPTTGLVDVLVIDHVEEPLPN